MAPAATPGNGTTPTSSLGRKMAALVGAGGAMVAGAEAEAVTYTPTAGVVAAQGIPGFSFVDASTVTLGNLRGPATAGTTAWDIDGVGGTNFGLVNSGTLLGSFSGLNGNSILFSNTQTGQVQNIATGGTVDTLQTPWKSGTFFFTYAGSNASLGAIQNFSPSGQFGFRFDQGGNTHYGWASLVVDGQAFGQGFSITEAYYQGTPDAAINVGAVPVPEPTAMALLAIGSAGVYAWRSRRKQAS